MKHSFDKNHYEIIFVGVLYATNNGDFRIEFENLNTDKVVTAKEPCLQLRKWNGFKRAIRYGTVQIQAPGDYIVRFKHIDDLKTDKSMLRLRRWLSPNPVPSSNIIVFIR